MPRFWLRSITPLETSIVSSDIIDMTLADLTLADLEAAFSDATLDATALHGRPVKVQFTGRVANGSMTLEISASTSSSCREHSLELSTPFFSKKSSVDQYLDSMLAMVARGAAQG